MICKEICNQLVSEIALKALLQSSNKFEDCRNALRYVKQACLHTKTLSLPRSIKSKSYGLFCNKAQCVLSGNIKGVGKICRQFFRKDTL